MFTSTRLSSDRYTNLIIPPHSMVVSAGLLGLFGGYTVAILLGLPITALVIAFALIGAATGIIAGSYAITSLTERAQWNSLLVGQFMGLCAFFLLLSSIF